MTDETKRKISEAKKGHTVSLETRLKISQTEKGKPQPWHLGNKYALGKKLSIATKLKISAGRQADKHWLWKGDNAKPNTIHKWVRKHFGKPNKCEHCGGIFEGKKIQWASKKHKYIRIRSEWLRLCVRCHIKYDKRENTLIHDNQTLLLQSLQPYRHPFSRMDERCS
jgi:hypothetical protein